MCYTFIMKKIKNPLAGKFELSKDGLIFSKGIKFGGELNPKVNSREWFYLLIESVKNSTDENILDMYKKLFSSWLGSPVTQWRTKKSLINKGYLI